MPVNRVRVLPDIPKNMPNMEILIREFETGSCSMASHRDTTSKSSTSSNGNFVKKIVQAYESSVKTFNENNQWEGVKEKSGFFNVLDVAQNQKNVEKNDSNLPINNVPSSQYQNNFNKNPKISLTSFEACEVEDDFVIINRYHSKSDRKTFLETWPGSSSKINMYSSMDDNISMNVQSSPSEKNETWRLKRRDQKLEDKLMNNKLMISSSLLEDVEDTDLDEDPLDDILTSSCDSSSNNSYRNLQADLYDFENEQWQLELSSTSLSSSKSSSESSHNSMLNRNSASLLLDLSFEDVTVTSSKDIPKNRENLQDSKSIPSPSFNFNRKSPPAIGASLNEDRPIKINNGKTRISTLGEKLSRKKPLKELLKSTFTTKLLSYKKVWKKSAEKQPNERTSDSGFFDRFLSSSSSSSQNSWRSDPDEKPSTPPTFGTFGRAKKDCVNEFRSKNSCMILTEVPHKEFTNDSEPSGLTPRVSLHHITSCKEKHRNIESSLKSMIPANSSTLKASCRYPPLPKHPYLTRNGIPKHPFIAETKLDQTMEKESVDEEEMRYDAREHESELELSSMSPMSQADFNISFSRMSEWLTSSPNNCDLLRSRSYKSTSALDELAPQQTPVRNVAMLCNFSMDFLSTIRNQRKPCTRYATVSPKNLRFSMSREKSREIEKCFDV